MSIVKPLVLRGFFCFSLYAEDWHNDCYYKKEPKITVITETKCNFGILIEYE